VNRPGVSGHFVESAKGPIFILLRRPAAEIRGCLLVLPAFAEEMNKSRRMVSEVAMGLSEHGIATVIPDLYGTGDSAGDFSDADWSTWQTDIFAAARWVEDQVGPITDILAVRTGAALAVSCLDHAPLEKVVRTVLWQPVFDGARHLAQFLRLRTAASLMEDRKESVADLRAQLATEGTLEVAGYGLSTKLANDIDNLKVPRCLPAEFGQITWMEIVRTPDAAPPLPAVKVVEATRAAGSSIGIVCFPGEPFWSATEIVVHRDMVQSTIATISGVGPTGERSTTHV
jgi:exosortase A-associated hydrolase 2